MADEVFLKNGDRITGTVISADDGKLVLEPDFAKSTRLSIPQSDVATFTTAAPLTVELTDGAVLNQPVAKAGEGQVVLAPSEQEPAPREVAIADIRRINPEAVAWHGSVGVNGLYGRSNITAMQVGINADAERRGEAIRINLAGAYNYGRQSVGGVDDTNVNNWLAQGKYDIFFSPRWYAYIGAVAAGDRVNFLRLRTTPSIGTGYDWIDRGDFHLRTEGGATYLYEDYTNEPAATTDIALRAAYHVDRTLDGGRISLVHNLEFLPSIERTEDFLLTTDAGVRFAFTSRMFSELKAKVVYDNEPGLASRKTTTELRLGVGLNY